MPDSTMSDYFSMLDIKPCFDIDKEELDKKYFALQAKFHPDMNVKAGDEEKIAAEERSMEINLAYKILSDDYQRALYILSLNGVNIKGDDANLKPDNKLLMETMEKREILSEIQNSNNLIKFIEELNQEKDLLLVNISKKFAEVDYNSAGELLLRFSYLRKIIIEAKEKNMN